MHGKASAFSGWGRSCQADATRASARSLPSRSSLLTLLTTTISAMPTYRTSSMCGFVVHCDLCSRTLCHHRRSEGEELVATPHRHGGKEKAEAILPGRHDAASCSTSRNRPTLLLQSRSITPSSSRKRRVLLEQPQTGWVTFLEAVIRAGLALTGTWPIRTERKGRMREIGSNALASSIILVCRKRPATRGNGLAARVSARTEPGASRGA